MCKYDYKKCKKCRNKNVCSIFINIEAKQLVINFKDYEKERQSKSLAK